MCRMGTTILGAPYYFLTLKKDVMDPRLMKKVSLYISKNQSFPIEIPSEFTVLISSVERVKTEPN